MLTMVEYHTLGRWDYAVLLFTLLLSLSIGIYFRLSGGKQKTVKEYLLGDSNQGALPVAVSLMTSFMSAITLLGVAAEVYMFGTLFLTILASYILFTAVAAYLYLPVFFKLQATSAYEYLERRFDSRVRLAASALYSLQMVLYMGVVLYAPAIALEALTGLSHNMSILVVGFICTLYSSLGGIKAVIWTDVLQSLLMYGALLSVIGTAAWSQGGFSVIWKTANEHGRVQFFDLSLDPTVRHTTWSLFFGGGLTFLSLYAVNQTQVQRYLTMRDHETAVRSLWLSLPLLYALLVACGLAGLGIFSVYSLCDPVRSGRIASLDQLMPLFVIDKMGHIPGMSGLFAAGIFSASLSSVSACVNSLAAVTVEDYIKPLVPKHKQQWHATAGVSKCVALLYGLVCMLLAYLAQHLGGLLQAGLSVLGILGGPLLGTFTLGMFLPSATTPGALAGMVSGLIAAVWVGFAQPKPHPSPLPLSTAGCFNMSLPVSGLAATSLPTPNQSQYPYIHRLSYLLYIVISCGTTLLVGWLVSQLSVYFGHQPPLVSPDLFSPPIAKYLKRHHRFPDNMALKVNMLQKTETKRTEI